MLISDTLEYVKIHSELLHVGCYKQLGKKYPSWLKSTHCRIMLYSRKVIFYQLGYFFTQQFVTRCKNRVKFYRQSPIKWWQFLCNNFSKFHEIGHSQKQTSRDAFIRVLRLKQGKRNYDTDYILTSIEGSTTAEKYSLECKIFCCYANVWKEDIKRKLIYFLNTNCPSTVVCKIRWEVTYFQRRLSLWVCDN